LPTGSPCRRVPRSLADPAEINLFDITKKAVKTVM
jgi:hypothetical protein